MLSPKAEKQRNPSDVAIINDANAQRSFAPVRDNIKAKFYVDGKDVFEATIRYIENAKSHIYMAFWIFVPTIYVRGREDSPRSPNDRLDMILKKKADEGVKIRIMLWDETNFVMSNFSKWSKHYLEDLTKNSKEPIVVIRHPQYRPLMFSHHQKFVVVDDKHAFIGGVDFATGRYDWHEHLITDPDGEHWFGIDFYAPLLVKATSDNFSKPDSNILDQTKTSRMPWHDIQMYVSGAAAMDAAFNFVQRWNHHCKTTTKYAGKPKYAPLSCEGYADYDKPPSDDAPKITKSKGSKSSKSKDLLEEPAEEFDKEDEEEEPTDIDSAKTSDEKTSGKHEKKSRSKDSKENEKKTSRKRAYRVQCQVIRSICEWSGSTRTENSIHDAYINAINNAEHFVYFENQFFISGTAPGVSNGIGQALVERICHAIEKKQTFRVVILTTQPEDLGTKVVPVVSLQYMTINRGPTSIIQQIRDRHPGVDVSQYIGVFQLRNHGAFKDGTQTSEQIFVHSKLLIVDDRVAIIASANLNDRSLIGNRDSELGVVVLDGPTATSKMAGQEYEVNKFVWALRKQLYVEHLGLEFGAASSDEQVIDPVSDEFFNKTWLSTARLNTDIYESVFPHIARDSMLTYEDFVQRQALKCDQTKVHKLKLTKGHLCMFPLQFLAAETRKLWESFVDDAAFS